jgi:hypothetical protein
VSDNQTPSRRLASLLLAEDIDEWVKRKRHPFPDVERSWRDVARQLERATDGQVDVSPETLRKWYAHSVHRAFVDRLDAEVNGAA